MASSHLDQPRHDKRLLQRAWFLSRTVIAVTLYILSWIIKTPFDTSPLLSHFTAPPLLRWDVFHFSQIAVKGYVYEHDFAFFPGTPAVMRLAAEFGLGLGRLLELTTRYDVNEKDVILGGSIAAFVFCDWTSDMYDLTLEYSSSPSFALLATLLSLLPLSPATVLYAPYAEPFFAALSFKGMLFAARRQWLKATLCFMASTSFRSNGILLVGYLFWGLVVEPLLKHYRDGNKLMTLGAVGKLLYAIILSTIVCVPFGFHQLHAFVRFCWPSSEPLREWCYKRPPFIYSFVQSHYWGVGFLRYWTVAQIPNFLMASPILIVLITSSVTHLVSALPLLQRRNTTNSTKHAPWLIKTFPHALHTLVFSMLLLFASHTQIVLRLSSSLPFTYWSIANLIIPTPAAQNVKEGSMSKPGKILMRTRGKLWIWYSIIWGSVSLVLWVAFLPPA